jgi:hypothetical protein
VNWGEMMARRNGGAMAIVDAPTYLKQVAEQVAEPAVELAEVVTTPPDDRADEAGVDRTEDEPPMSEMSDDNAREASGPTSESSDDNARDPRLEDEQGDAGDLEPVVIRGDETAGEVPVINGNQSGIDAPARRPRRTKLDVGLAFKIVAQIRAGVPQGEVARSSGVARSTFQSWLARGRAEDPGYVEFVAAIRQAEIDHKRGR